MIFDASQTVLDLSNNGIASLRGFDELQKTRRPTRLDLSRNPLRSLEHIVSSATLVALAMDNTELANFAGVKPQPALREVSFRNAPVACAPLYRVACLLALGPKLRSIDGVAVTAAEIDAAFGFGADAAVAVSFGWLPPNTVARSSEDYAKIVRALHAERRALQKREAAVGAAPTASTATLAQVAERMNLYQRAAAGAGVAAAQAGGAAKGAAESQQDANSSNSSALQAKVAELEAAIAQLRKEKEELQQQRSTDTKPSGDAPSSQQQPQQQPAVFHPMKVPGVTVSELDTVDTLSWAAPSTTIYAFVTGSAAAVSLAPAAAPSPLSGGADAGAASPAAMMPHSVALSLSRHTIEIQRLMSRQALFRHPLSFLARVEAGEVGAARNRSNGWARGPAGSASSGSSGGPFSTVASLHLHFSDGTSALLLFTAQAAMNAVFKALKYRCVGASRTISFSLDANLESLPDFIAPGRVQDDFVDLFSKSATFNNATANSPSFSLAASFATGPSPSPSVILGMPPSVVVPPIKNFASAAAAGNAQARGASASGSGSAVPSVSADRVVAVRARTPSSAVAPGGGFKPAVVGGGGGGGRVVVATSSAAAGANRNPDDDFELDSDGTDDGNGGDDKNKTTAPSATTAAAKRKTKNSDSDSSSDDDENAKSKPKADLRGGLVGPGGVAVVIPTGIKVGRSTTPQVVTPTTPAAAVVGSSSSGGVGGTSAAAPSGGGGATAAPVVARSATPSSQSAGSPASTTSQPVVIGAFKGRSLVVGGKVEDSSDDSDD